MTSSGSSVSDSFKIKKWLCYYPILHWFLQDTCAVDPSAEAARSESGDVHWNIFYDFTVFSKAFSSLCHVVSISIPQIGVQPPGKVGRSVAFNLHRQPHMKLLLCLLWCKIYYDLLGNTWKDMKLLLCLVLLHRFRSQSYSSYGRCWALWTRSKWWK